MFLIKLLALSIILVAIEGCTGITPAYLVDQKYQVYKIGNSAEFATFSEMELETRQAARTKCRELGKEFEYISERRGNDGPIGMLSGRTLSYEMIFKCK